MQVARPTLVRAALAVAATASVGLFAASREPAERPPSPSMEHPAPAPVERAAAQEALKVELLKRETQARAEEDLFTARSWQPPPPPPPKAAPPPPPPAAAPPAPPPLPFAFVGTFDTAEKKTVFYLAEGDRLHAAAVGEVLNERYRIDSADAEGLTFTYLPLAVQQRLAFGSLK